MKLLSFCAFLLTFFLVACEQQSSTSQQAIYFWKTHLRLSEAQEAFLQQHQISKIYVRYCDVGLLKNAPEPIAPIQIDTMGLAGKTVVPVIYLKNEVFVEVPNKQYLKTLAQNLSAYIKQINAHYHLQTAEVQIDCDWTLSTRYAYFDFLKYFKEALPKQLLSATIRLHQVKYFKDTGVPPVDYGVLMYYNMGKITATGSNSIYDRDTAHRYLKSLKKYPLPLNVALPMFSWGVHSSKGQVLHLVNGLTTSKVQELAGLLPTAEPNVYEVKEQTYYQGRLWEVGDLIKIEEVSEAQREEMQADLLRNLAAPPKEIILFDLND